MKQFVAQNTAVGTKRLWKPVLPGILISIVVLFAGAVAGGSDVEAKTGKSRSDMEFNHGSTGFQLTGGHTQVNCERCHMQGLFRGTPTQCFQCHSPGGRIISTFKPANHIPTTLNCNSCHRITNWKPAFFTHNGVTPGSCAKCHNNNIAQGKPAAHLPTAMSCDSCHRTSAWTSASFRHIGVVPGTCMTCHNGTQARGKHATHVVTAASCDSCHRVGGSWVLVSGSYDHSGVTPGTCTTCHNGSTARGKAANHLPTTASCDACHRPTGWIPATFSHTGVTPGTCATCHNGGRARGKAATHVPTTAACDTCHRTTAWTPATFSHTGIAPGSCATCHNGSTATGKSTSHFVTTQSCDSCHRAGVGWTPVTAYTHRTAFYKAHRSSVTCNACHTNNNEVIAWRNAGYKPDCAGCHAGDFKQGPHKKVDSPVIYYSVLELKDCSGSCHQYTNSTLTTISKNRSGQHRPTGSF